ncbi:mCG147783 [Mus musculus]|nr:mCG147783 [Mus musculus]
MCVCERLSDPLEQELTNNWGLPCGCWELNPSPLEEQPVLITAGPSLQPLRINSYAIKVVPDSSMWVSQAGGVILLGESSVPDGHLPPHPFFVLASQRAIVPSLWRPRQESHEFKSSLGYKARPSFKQSITNTLLCVVQSSL